MKFNWGHGITLVLVLFGGLMITMVYKSSQQRIDLVTEDYYNTEDAYQERQIRAARAQQLSGQFAVERTKEGVLIHLPNDLAPEIIEGSITFYNPTDKRLDFVLDLQPTHQQFVDQPNLPSGRWTVKVDIPGETGYYFEKNVFF